MPRAGGLWTSFSSSLTSSGFVGKVLDWVYPPKCPLCTRLSPQSPCEECRDAFEPISPQRSELFYEGGLSYRVILYRYSGRAAQSVRRLKYGRCTSLEPFMAGQIAEAIERLDLDPDLIVPVPIHWSRRCERGFNQSELLCSGLESSPNVLRRVRRTRPQATLSPEERNKNLKGAFEASADVSGQRVLLVDDVLTSGHTARECAAALLAAGAREVGVLAFCGNE